MDRESRATHLRTKHHQTTMGIHGLLAELPGGKTSETKRDFSKLTMLSGQKRKCVDIDTGTLLFICALRHKVPYLAGDYLPAACEFLRQTIVFDVVHEWDCTYIFDGVPPPEKAPEHERRQLREDSITINSTYIAMCAKICRQRCINYTVAPKEADMQVGRRDKSAIVLTRDGDIVAYDNPITVIVDSYPKEEYRVIDMTAPITPKTKEELPLYYYYKKHGIKIIHYWAATMGCDVSKDSCGLKHIGRAAFFSALASFEDKDPSSLDESSFASALRRCSSTLAATFFAPRRHAIRNELRKISEWFSEKGTFYDVSGNVYTISGKLEEGASRKTLLHMNGDLDPKTRSAFTHAQKEKITSVESHHLLHNSAVGTDKLNGLSFPEGKSSVEQCTVDELKAMIIPRGGKITGKNGKPLKRAELEVIVQAFLLAEKENPSSPVYFNRSRTSNGFFGYIDTGEKQSVTKIIEGLTKSRDHELSLQQLFWDVKLQYDRDGFVEDFNTICLEAPEMKENFIIEAFAHVGNSASQKSIRDGCKKVLDMNKVLYHAIAIAQDGKSMYVVSKQQASMMNDERTRNQTPAGEKPNRAEYLVMAQIGIRQTTLESDGHVLGMCTHVMRAYCAMCKAGCGMCSHKSGLCWMQHMHWGEGRPTPKPATSAFASWIPGSNSPRSCTTLQPATDANIQQLPSSNKEAQKRLDNGKKKRAHEGVSARYDWHGADETLQTDLNSSHYVTKARLEAFFQAIKEDEAAIEDGDE